MGDWHKEIREVTKQLDRTNVRILSAMWRYGPRNLLEVSRRTRIPFTSVYHRVGKLEAKSNRIAVLIPHVAGLGLMRVGVFVLAKPGLEEKVTLALKIPNYCRCVNRCEGQFSHFSVQVVPVKFLKQFKQYIKRLLQLGLIAKFSIIPTGEFVPNFSNFDYYNPVNGEWTFQWERWLKVLNRVPTLTIEDPPSYEVRADKKDILIVRELEKNGRTSFADLAPLLGISLQGVKYHYDKKLVPAGIVKYFGFDLLPFPEELSAQHEILVNFKNAREMNKFYSLVSELFFVRGVAKVLRQDALLVRTYIPQNQISNLFTFLSVMAQEGRVESYSAIRQTFVPRYPEAISYELYDKETGWNFDLKRYMAELSKLARARVIHRRV